MASFGRESKFRHCLVSVAKKEVQYENLRTQQPTSDVNGVTGNSKYFAYIDSNGSGSCLGVLPLTSYGKNHIPVSSPAYQQPIIRAHSQAVQDFEFNPFNTEQIFSCSTDKFVKLWTLPTDGLVVDVTSPTASFSTKSMCPLRGKFRYCFYLLNSPYLFLWNSSGMAVHKSVAGLLAVRGQREISLFDTETQTELFNAGTDLFPQDILSMSWSFHGDLLVTTVKDKTLKLIDFRASNTGGAGSSMIVSSSPAHTGIRFSRNVWLGNSPYLLSVGHSSTQERETMVWDSRNMSTPMKRERIDTATGSIIPIFEPDHNLLLLAGKGDVSLRMYEVSHLTSEGDTTTSSATSSATCTVHALSNTNLGDVTRGFGLLPKQVNDVMSCEIMRCLKLTDNTIQPIHVTVPRKEKLKFHEDLYPATFSEAPSACLKDEWLSGRNVVVPNTVPIIAPSGAQSAGNRDSVRSSVSFSSLSLDTTRGGTGSASGGNSPVPGGSGANSPTPNNNNSGTDSRRASSRIASGLASMLKFRHMYGTEYTRDNTFYNLSPDLSTDNPVISCSDTYFAIPYRGGGGPVYISKLDNYGKVSPEAVVVNGHKAPVVDISFSPFHSGLMATASSDCTVKIWDLDFHNQLCQDKNTDFYSNLAEITPVFNLTTHTNSLRTCNFHPVVSNLLVTTSQDMTLRCFDVSQGSEVSVLNVYKDTPDQASGFVNVSFNYNGTLVALANKDRIVRICDLRCNSIVTQSESHLSTKGSLTPNTASSTLTNRIIGRNLRVEWCNGNQGTCDPIATVSAGSNGMRNIHLWDPRNMNKPIQTKQIDNGSGQLFPMFDEGMSTLFVVGKGDTVVRTYEVQSLVETTDSTTLSNTTLNASGVNSSAVSPAPAPSTFGHGRFQTAEEQNKQPSTVFKMPVSTSIAAGGSGGTVIDPSELKVNKMHVDIPVIADNETEAAEATPALDPLSLLFFEKSAEFQSSREPFAGICMVPKRCLDVKNIEVSRLLKLTSDTIIPIKFNVPRADHLKEYFHDDIFLPVRSKETEYTVSDWKNVDIPSSQFIPALESLKPIDMITMSEKPPEAAPSQLKSKIETFRNDIARKEEENKIKEDNFAKLQKLAEQNAQYNINRSGPMKIGGVIVSNAQLNAPEEVDSDDNWDD